MLFSRFKTPKPLFDPEKPFPQNGCRFFKTRTDNNGTIHLLMKNMSLQRTSGGQLYGMATLTGHVIDLACTQSVQILKVNRFYLLFSCFVY